MKSLTESLKKMGNFFLEAPDSQICPFRLIGGFSLIITYIYWYHHPAILGIGISLFVWTFIVPFWWVD
jgi:hypothetical protein